MIYRIAIDIGGTKTASGIINENGEISMLEVKPTIVGLKHFPEFLAQVIKQCRERFEGNDEHLSRTILLALPGNFEPGYNIHCRSGSARQLVFPNEFIPEDNFHEWLSQYLDPTNEIFAMNDAMAQALGCFYSIWNNNLDGQVFLYMGPGTGLGGAIIKSGATIGDYTFLTDGHIYDIQVVINGELVMAEDILSGRGVLSNLNMTAKELNETFASDPPHEYLVKMADVGIALIQAIKSGHVTKKNFPWTEEDTTQAKPINHVILGGSIGTKGQIGRYLKERITIAGFHVHQIESPILDTIQGLNSHYLKLKKSMPN